MAVPTVGEVPERFKCKSPTLLKSCAHMTEQGRIHGNPVADGLAGAVRKPLRIQECDGPTDRRTDLPTDRHGKV